MTSTFDRSRATPFDVRARTCSTGRRGPNAKRYQRRYRGIHFADPEVRRALARSSQIVGISATGRRSRRALATSSMPISNPASDSMPTSRTNSVEYALNEFVASRVPTRAEPVQRQAGQSRQLLLTAGPPTCWPPPM